MKNNLVRVSILVLGAAAAYAQSLNPVMKANIPFDFSASGVNMPAGTYTVETRNPIAVILRSYDSHSRAMVPSVAAVSGNPQTEGRLVFHRYGNQYFLADIWISGSYFGRHITPTKQERQLAQRQSEPPAIILAAIR